MTENNTYTTNSKSENSKKIEAIIKEINIFKESSENEIRNSRNYAISKFVSQTFC